MNLIKKIADIATGGIGDLAFKVAEKWFPPEMSEADRSQAKLAFQNMELERARQSDAAALEADKALTDRIQKLEGTAHELKQIPIIGPLVIFLRACQRPAWGFVTMWLDWHWFAEWGGLSGKQEAALVIINLLVLAFLFGERAVRNIAPLVADVLRARSGS